MNKVDIIEKETIPHINFCQEEVLDDESNQKRRLRNLTKATSLGNGQRRKVCIVFKTANGRINQVETTVWAVGNQFVSLKSGVSIPINSILQVNF